LSELQRKSDRFLIVIGELDTFLSVIDKDKLVKIKTEYTENRKLSQIITAGYTMNNYKKELHVRWLYLNVYFCCFIFVLSHSSFHGEE